MDAPLAGIGRPGYRGVVELLGPAGSGKSTLLETLAERDPSVRAGLSLWGLPRADQVIGALSLIPTAVGAFLEGEPLRSTEFGHMIRLEALERVVRRTIRTPDRLVVLDEGPLFALAWIRIFHGALGGRRRAAWRDRSLRAWSGLLTGVIYLDAPNAVLAERIRRRRKVHPLKGATTDDLDRFAESFRRTFSELLVELSARSAVPVVRRRTDGVVPTHQARELALAFSGAADD